MAQWLEALAAAQARHAPFVMITLTGIRGSAPGELGARAFVDETGLLGGTIGGGKVEHRAILHAKTMLQAGTQGRCEALAWNLTRDIEMTCGGEVTLLFEVMGASAMSIALFGAGHVAQALVRALLPLDCRVVVYDSRPEWLARLPTHDAVTAVVSDDLPGAVARCQASDFFVVMTRGHASDLPILTELYRLHPAPRYVGCMGSAVKAARLRRELALADVSVAALANFYCPIGLPVGGNVPAEIAISVVAQLLQVRDGGTSQPGADAAASAP